MIFKKTYIVLQIEFRRYLKGRYALYTYIMSSEITITNRIQHIINGETFEYNTHQPYLKFAIQHTKGNVLECGMGFTSTLMIRSLLKGTNRRLISLESNKDWYDNFSKYQDKNFEGHLLNLENWNESSATKWVDYIANFIDTSNIDCVFLDQEPHIARNYVLQYFLDKVKYIVIHDVDEFAARKWSGTQTEFKRIGEKMIYNCEFPFKHYIYNIPPLELFVYCTGPPTILLSNTIPDETWEKERAELSVYMEALYQNFTKPFSFQTPSFR